MMDRRLLREAHALFERALDVEPAERDAWLDRECGSRPRLRALVDSLIESVDTPHDLLDAGPGTLALLADDRQSDDGPAMDRIGPYRIIREIGRGGMATVYLAERAAGDVVQRVALKLVKRGIDTDEVVRRFAHERRVLASLEHPNVARFFDAGTSGDGRPYLVMEYIEGRSVTQWADEHRQGIGARLELFETICMAVQFAHQRLVIHRDIKPANILVTGRGDVKLLDFGIAKLLSDEPDTDAPLTRTGIRVLTPEYAAPEQLRGEPVSTATDVWALGLVLYEMLAGGRPSARPDAVNGGRNADAPSTVVRRMTREQTADAIASARSTTPSRLQRRLRGDLDRIVLKALDPDPLRRYASARDLRDDLERHRRGLPIVARPATVGYRVRKFARRHRAAVPAVAVGVVLIGAFSGFHAVRITRERDVARAEADKARATTQFLQRLLGDAYPSVALGDTFSMAELLSRAVARIDSVSGQPEIQAELLRTLGDVYREQGRFDDALPLLERAVSIHRERGDHDLRAAGRALDALGHLQHERMAYEAALAAHGEALEIFESVLAPDDSLVLFAMNNIAAAAAQIDDHETAIDLYRTVLDRHGRLFTDTSQLVHTIWNNMGQLHHAMGEYEEAERAQREAIRLRRIALPPDHPSLALSLNNQGSTIERLGRLDEAEALHREALDMFRRVYGPFHHRVGLSAYNLARVLRQTGKLEEAEELNRLTLRIDRATFGDAHVEVGVDLRGLATTLAERGNCEDAVSALREADRIFALNELPLTHRRRLTARAEQGACLTTLGRYEEGESTLRESLAAVRAAPTDADSAGASDTVDRLIALYEAWGRPAAADSVRRARTATSHPGG